MEHGLLAQNEISGLVCHAGGDIHRDRRAEIGDAGVEARNVRVFCAALAKAHDAGLKSRELLRRGREVVPALHKAGNPVLAHVVRRGWGRRGQQQAGAVHESILQGDHRHARQRLRVITKNAAADDALRREPEFHAQAIARDECQHRAGTRRSLRAVQLI